MVRLTIGLLASWLAGSVDVTTAVAQEPTADEDAAPIIVWIEEAPPSLGYADYQRMALERDIHRSRSALIGTSTALAVGGALRAGG